MASGTFTTDVPALIPEVVEPGIREVFYEYTSIMQAFPPRPGGQNGKVEWDLGDEGTDNAQTTSEGAALPDANIDKTLTLTQNIQVYDVVAKVTQETLDNSGEHGIDPWTWSTDRAARRLSSKANTTLISEFESAVSSTGTYGGKTRTSHSTALVSYEESTTDSLSYDYMATMMRTLMDANRGVEWGELRIYMSPTLLFRYGKVANQSGTVARATNRQVGATSDAGLVFGANGGTPEFEGVPIVPVVGMTSSTVVMGPGGMVDECKIAEQYGPRIMPLGKVARDNRAVIDCAYKLRIRQPALWGKLTNKS
jgi:hypothetical protein